MFALYFKITLPVTLHQKFNVCIFVALYWHLYVNDPFKFFLFSLGLWNMGDHSSSSTCNTMQRPCDQTISQTPEHSIIIIIIIMHEILKFYFAWICCI